MNKTCDTNKGGGEVEAKELKRIQGGGGNGFIRRR